MLNFLLRLLYMPSRLLKSRIAQARLLFVRAAANAFPREDAAPFRMQMSLFSEARLFFDPRGKTVLFGIIP
jgi:hypothetical protein